MVVEGTLKCEQCKKELYKKDKETIIDVGGRWYHVKEEFECYYSPLGYRLCLDCYKEEMKIPILVHLPEKKDNE